MKKEQLINKIDEAFNGVKLEEGIGLWEGQGHDDRLTIEECKKLRKNDEKNNWKNIPVIDLYKCNSSLSFFDAKGMRFHMPIFLLFALDFFKKEEDELVRSGFMKTFAAPDIESHLLSGLKYRSIKGEIGKSMSAYDHERFSLFTIAQLECLVEFLKFRMNEMEKYYNTFEKELGAGISAVKYDKDYIQLEKGVEYWTKKIANCNTLNK